MPSFTNPNNLSIVTGVPPSVHGICGNYFFDSRRGDRGDDERPELPARADDPRRASPTPGAKVAVVTAKDKLRTLLGHRPDRASASRPRRPTRRRVAENGIDDVLELVGMPLPSVYSAELSEFVFAAGVQADGARRGPDLMYLSTTDYVQHKHAPGHRRRQRVLRA